MLISKRPQQFLPENWPTYFSKSKGCFVWDLDGNKFVDMNNGLEQISLVTVIMK